MNQSTLHEAECGQGVTEQIHRTMPSIIVLNYILMQNLYIDKNI